MAKVLYPGSFDPVTFGHLDLINRIYNLFDEIIVAVVVNPTKQSLLTVSQRVELLKLVKAKYWGDKITIITGDGLLADLIMRYKVEALVKGVRNTLDFEYELPMSSINEKLTKIPTVLVPSSPEYSYISSSRLKEVFSLGGDVSYMAPTEVIECLKENISK